jgi:hypothetical protein
MRGSVVDHSELLGAIRAHERAVREVEVSGIAVWTSLAKAQPELAAEILQLFSSVEAAARWATTSSGDLDGSPALRVAEGRVAEILSRVRKTTYGLVG